MSDPKERTVKKHAFAILLTGLPASGKSTLAAALEASLLPREVCILDGDRLRQTPGHPTGFSRAEREASVRRAALLARECVAKGVIAVCALIAPYASARAEMREIVEAEGGFVEIFLATPLAVCQKRDPKGHYAKAVTGLLPHFTGVSDPYETPEKPDLKLDTSSLSIEGSVAEISACLIDRGYIRQAL